MDFFSFAGKSPWDVKYVWDKYLVWGGVSSLSPTDWDRNLAPTDNIQ